MPLPLETLPKKNDNFCFSYFMHVKKTRCASAVSEQMTFATPFPQLFFFLFFSTMLLSFFSFACFTTAAHVFQSTFDFKL